MVVHVVSQANFCTEQVNGTELAPSAQNPRKWLQTPSIDCSDKGWSFCLEGWTKRFVGWTFEADSLWELGVSLAELCNLRPLYLSITDDASPDDQNRLLGCTVSSSHFHVHLWDGSAKCRVSVLLVHVDDDGTGQISEVNSIVPDDTCLLLENL